MGVFSSPGTEQPRDRRRTIRRTFVAMVAGPVACLVVLWGLALGGVIGGALGGPDTPHHDHQVVVDFVAVIGVGVAIVVAAVVMMGLFARRLSQDITDLEATARQLAEERMPELVERLRRGEQGVVPEEITPQLRTKTAEIARAEAAMASLQHTAAAAAAGEASLRNGIGQVFVSLARRNQSLLQRQLRLIDALEQKASDPATLADLFPLDHLTTRMRRHAEGLIILSGAAPGRSWSEPVPVIDVIRGAVAEVEDYKRVTVLTMAEDAVAGLAAADMIHLLAELIENATLSSPSGTRVEVRAERVANGFTIEIDDRGLGIEAGQLQTINQQLADPPDFDLANADQLGLFVVGKLAARHGVRVALRPSPYGGTHGRRAHAQQHRGADAHDRGGHRPRPPPGARPDARPGSASRRRARPDRPAFGPATAARGRHRGHGDGGRGLRPRTGLSRSRWLRGREFRRRWLGSAGHRVRLRGPGPRPGGKRARHHRYGARLRGHRPWLHRHRAGSARSWPAPLPSRPGHPGPRRPAKGDDPGLAPGPGAAGTYRGLPRRVRQASLNPRLKDTPSAARGGNADGVPPAGGRSPEEARNLVASMQSGWQRGREDQPDGDSAAAAQTARRPDSEAPQGEEALWTSRARRPGPDSS